MIVVLLLFGAVSPSVSFALDGYRTDTQDGTDGSVLSESEALFLSVLTRSACLGNMYPDYTYLKYATHDGLLYGNIESFLYQIIKHYPCIEVDEIECNNPYNS